MLKGNTVLLSRDDHTQKPLKQQRQSDDQRIWTIEETVSIHQIHVGQKLIKLSQFKQISDMDVMACVETLTIFIMSPSVYSPTTF